MKKIIFVFLMCISLVNAGSVVRSTFLNDTSIVKNENVELTLRKERQGTIYDIVTYAPNIFLFTKNGKIVTDNDTKYDTTMISLNKQLIADTVSKYSRFKKCNTSLLIPIEQYEGIDDNTEIYINNHDCVITEINALSGEFFLGKTLPGKYFEKNMQYKNVVLDIKNKELTYIDNINAKGIVGDTIMIDIDSAVQCKATGGILKKNNLDNYLYCEICPENSIYSEKYKECLCKVGFDKVHNQCIAKPTYKEPVKQDDEINFTTYNTSNIVFGLALGPGFVNDNTKDAYSIDIHDEFAANFNLTWVPKINIKVNDTDVFGIGLDIGFNVSTYAIEYEAKNTSFNGYYTHAYTKTSNATSANVVLGGTVQVLRFSYTYDFLWNLVDDTYLIDDMSVINLNYMHQHRFGFDITNNFTALINLQCRPGITALTFGVSGKI